jgi:DnaJ-domain-containing protein 1
MANYFARLGFDPRPWLDPELLKSRFLELSATIHPDKAAAENKAASEHDFQDLNTAYNTLRNTRSRLLHLLAISGVPKSEHVQNVPPAALQYFSAVAEATNRADALIKRKAAAASPMLKVQLMEEALPQIDAVQSLQQQLQQNITSIEENLKQINKTWQHPPAPATLAQLSESAAALGFFERWTAQLQERVGALTF